MEWIKKKPVGGSKYGLQLKIAAPGSKKAQFKKPIPFSLDHHEDDYTVEDDIARQASKKLRAHEVDVQVKQALEQDSTAFDYDGVYEEMKGRQAQIIQKDRATREPKYIGKLLEKAKVRAVEQDISFERRLAKERDKDAHLFGDKETFVTSAYKKKLLEQGKWQEEQRLRELREKAHEISGKHDISDFYRNLLHKNVAFGAESAPRSSLLLKNLAVGAENAPRSPPERQDTGEFKECVEVDKSGEQASSLSTSSLSVRTSENSLETSTKNDLPVPGSSASNTKSKEEILAIAKQKYLERKRQRKN